MAYYGLGMSAYFPTQQSASKCFTLFLPNFCVEQLHVTNLQGVGKISNYTSANGTGS